MYPDRVFERGLLLCYRVFDAGETIDLAAAERVLGAHRVEINAPLMEGLVMPTTPIEIELGSRTIELPRLSRTLTAKARARLFDFGAISISFEIPFDQRSSAEALTPLCDALYDAPELDAAGAAERARLLEKLGAAVEKPHDWRECESYTVVFVERVSCSFDQLRSADTVAKLLLGETSPEPLSDATRDDILGNAQSYLASDLVIADWNSALVIEPTGSRVVPFVLELATVQLLEFRYYDGLLEAELARLYDYFEKARSRMFRSPYNVEMRKAMRRILELTELTERVDNTIKSVGDFYLARVYDAALARFRVPSWRESVESKLRLAARAYELLKDEVEVSRGQLLEVIVVVLIALELLTALRPH